MTKANTATTTALENLEQDHGIEADAITFSGGGKGQRGTVEFDGREFTVKGTSRAQVVDRLNDLISIFIAEQDEVDSDVDTDDIDEDLISEDVAKPAKVDRITDEEAIAAILKAWGTDTTTTIEFDPDDESSEPGPVWSEDGTTLISLTPCVAECMAGTQPYCECKCRGANHGIGSPELLGMLSEDGDNVAARESFRPVQMGEKPCRCGCGLTTQRRFVPGHDARFYGLLKAQAYAAKHDLEYTDDESLRKVVRSAKAKARRAAAKAAKAEQVEQAA